MKHLIFILFSIILCFVSVSSISATNVKVSRFSPNEGLAQSYVTSLLLDRKGYLWLATKGGLNRYDGYQISTINGPNKELRDRSIDFIYEDSHGDIWIATSFFGLYRYHIDSDIFTRELVSGSAEEHSPITMLETQQKGQYWLGRIGDLALFNSDTGEIKSIFNIPSSEEFSAVRKLTYYKHYLIIASTEGAFVLNTKTEQVVPLAFLSEEPSHPDQYNVKSLHIAGEELWLGTIQGLHKIQLRNIALLFEDKVVDEKAVEEKVTQLDSKQIVSDLNIWKIIPFNSGYKLATNRGLFNYSAVDNRLTKSSYLEDSDYLLSDPSVVDMLVDNSGAMWLATKTDGAFYIDRKKTLFQNYHQKTLKGGLSNNNVWQIVQHEDDVWLATSNGLTRLDLDTYQSQTYLQGYATDQISDEFDIAQMQLFEDALWLSTSRGFFTFDLKTMQVSEVTVNEPNYNDIFTNQIILSSFSINGDMYFKSFKYGYFTYNPRSKKLNKLELSNEDEVEGYYGYFLPPLNGEEEPLFYHHDTLYRVSSNNSLEKIYQLSGTEGKQLIELVSHVTDNNGILWLSFSGFGLIGLDSDNYELVHRIDDKRGTLFYGLTLDSRGMIWMTSHSGLWRFNSDTLHLRQFTVEDGIITNEFNDGATLKYSDGRLLVGSINGLTSFFPELNDKQESITKRINITSITLMSRKLGSEQSTQQKTLELDYDDVGLEISFSAMVFSYQDRIEFEYRLDDSPLISTSNNKVAFARLAPGQHTFFVRARDPISGDFTDFTSLTIQVQYPPWQSPAAFAIYCLLIGSLVFAWQVRHHRYQNSLLAAHKQSQENETRFKMALESSQSGVWEWRSQIGHIYQPRLCDELGYENTKISLDDFLNKVHPDDRAKYRIEWLEFVNTDKGIFDLTYRLRHSQGYWRWYKDVGRVIEWRDKLPQLVAGTFTNLTYERNLERSARLFGLAFEYTSDWVFVMDQKLTIIAINKALREAYDIDLMKDSLRKLTFGMTAKRRAHHLCTIRKMQPGKHFHTEENITQPDGTVSICSIKVTAVASEAGIIDNYIVVITDVSSQKQAEQELHVLRHYDNITGLPNRNSFVDHVEHAIDFNQRSDTMLAVIFVDLDNFKKINDSFEHNEADKLLIKVAHRLEELISSHNTVARITGDEFVVLLEDIQSRNQVSNLCKKIITSIKQPIELADQKVVITASIGVAFYGEDGQNANELIKASDIAMHHVKEQGGDRFLFFKEEMNSLVQRKLKLETELKYAWLNNELYNHYQPIIDTKTARIAGFENLIRWHHKEELVDSEYLISIAEDTGLITPITLASLERAIIDVRNWREYLPHCYVSVNLSAKTFQSDQLAEQIINLCDCHNVAYDALALEITESVLMADSDSARCTMETLKDVGCRIYLDDFGTGYSSLTYLKRFPVDVVKIDKSFVHNIGINNDDEMIIGSTLSLAHSLGKDCIAEGVENKHQVEFLENLGCTHFQGYFFSASLGESQVIEFISNNLN